MVRLLSAGGLRMDLAVTGSIDPRVRASFEALGARIFVCESTYEPLRMAHNLRRLLREHGPYDVLHCHMHRGNAQAAAAGRFSGVPVIVVHSHLDTLRQDELRAWETKPKRWLAAALQRVFAHQGLACSIAAGDCLFGDGWRNRKQWSVHYCGMDFSRFQQPVDRCEIRRRQGIPLNAFVIGHVGRFDPVKNQAFILDLAAHYTASHYDAYFVLVGDGVLLPALSNRAREIGLSERVRFLGARNDVPELLLGLFDVFLLPSLAEGLPISLLEAQAAGLPALISDRVTPEARVLPAIQALRTDQPVEDWAAALDRLRGRRVDSQTALAQLGKAGFRVEQSASQLARYYRDLRESKRQASRDIR
jgi:glycosyltransferase involved in cell wall biosynthesis